MLLLFSLLTSVALVNGAPTVLLGNTTLIGLDLASFKEDFFGGIPFAEPPLGNLRLRRPVLKPFLEQGTFNATSFGASCLQEGLPLDIISEDCLTINVLRPTGTPANAKLPVMFWTYGGGFDTGLAAFTNASELVAQSVARGTPVIYVNFNYRVGPLGFPQGQEAANNSVLNLGIRDQITALEWVQLNIGAFGGDKDKVTVFGESAGSIMTSLLFLSPPIINRLARAAILESGSQATTSLFTADRGEATWEDFVGGVPSCASIATSGDTFGCLRNASTAEIFQGLAAALSETTAGFPWAPIIDGPGGLIPDLPSVLFERGQFARLPFIAGTNLDEGTIFTNQAVNSTDEISEAFFALVSPSVSPTTLESAIVKLLELYPDIPALGSPFNTGNDTFGLSSQYKRAAAIAGDLDFHSQRRIWIETAAKAGVKTYGYLFTQPQLQSSPALGVYHSSELSYVFGPPSDNSSSAVLISQTMMDYWVSFAANLTPNDGHGIPCPEWTQFTPENQAVIQLNGANITMIPDTFRAEQITFINSNPVIWRH
ncbi:extracellular triacylglycerol lipase precursor [Mycena galericulata]|nr:extracellular triacylglycerol lipase precursor [Mycena galericulata]